MIQPVWPLHIARKTAVNRRPLKRLVKRPLKRLSKQLLSLGLGLVTTLGLFFFTQISFQPAWDSASSGSTELPNWPQLELQFGLPPASAQAVSTRSALRMASFPVENFQTYTSPFGYRRAATGGPSTEFHYGLDMAAPEGSYIRNWWQGQVVEVSDDSRCGTSIAVQSGTWEHIYCHMNGRVEVIDGQRYMVDRKGGIQIREGQTLLTGVRIGRVGMTGRTTGPHLHWGLKNQGNWVDPGEVLRMMQASWLS